MPGILIGSDLAEQLGVDVGDEVQLITPQGDLTPFMQVFRPKRFQIAGIFTLGLYPYDAGYGFTRLDVARRILGPDAPVYMELRVDDMFRAQEVVDGIVARYGAEYIAEEWGDRNRSLFSALWLEKMAISITIGLIVMVAALNIVASLILLVMEKSRDIAILKTMGSSSASIRCIVSVSGSAESASGSASSASAPRTIGEIRARERRIGECLRGGGESVAELARHPREPFRSGGVRPVRGSAAPVR